MAGLWCERSGVVNIGIEGMMLAGAGVGFTVYAVLGDARGHRLAVDRHPRRGAHRRPVAALHALVSVSFRVDQIISGVVINLLALGLTSFLRSQVIVPARHLDRRSTSDDLAAAAVRASRWSASSCSPTSRSSSRCS